MNPIPNGRAAGDALRMSWRHATLRRRAMVIALTALPFALASGLTAILLSYGGDPREVPAQERRSPDPRAGQADGTRGAAAEQPRPGTLKLGLKAKRPASAGADRPVAAGATGARGKNRQGPRKFRGDRPARRPAARPRAERRASASPGPAPRSPSRRGQGGDGRRQVSNPSPPPASTLTPPPADAPTQPPPARQPAPQVMAPDRDYEGDSDSGRPAPAPVGEGAGGAPARPGSEREARDRGGAPHRPEHARGPHLEHPHEASGGAPPAAGPIRPCDDPSRCPPPHPWSGLGAEARPQKPPPHRDLARNHIP
jgi:translation initiation factor IF-2